MSRINTNVQSLLATRALTKNQGSLNQALTRLSTGLRINSGQDDPAGLIASESLRSTMVAIGAAVDNANRANSIMGVAEGGLQEVNRLLLELEDLIDRSANEGGLSEDEIAANQLQIDTILASINRIADTTEFSGRKLLNGSYDYTMSGTTASDQRISAVQINAAKIPEGSTRDVTVEVQTPSMYALISGAGTGLDHALSGVLTLQIQGNYGTENLSFASGTTLQQIATAVNGSTQLTGVSAIINGTGANTYVQFTSIDYGSDAFVSVEVLDGTFNANATDNQGQDGTVTINGQAASVRGLEASVRSRALSADLILAEDFARMSAAGANPTTATFTITGGGAVFAISPTVGLVGQESIGLAAVTTGSLGNGLVGFLTSLGRGETNDLESSNLATAQRIIRSAIDQVSTLRGRIGAFQKDTLVTTVNALGIALENATAAESAIRDADFAVETSALTRAQIMVQSSMATLQLANVGPQNMLALLG